MAVPKGNVAIDFVGQLPEVDPGGVGDRNDYRPVPADDRGNDGYGDRGGFGTWQDGAQQRPDPSDVKHFAGYGAAEADLVRGFCEPGIRDDPAYQLDNYRDRSSRPALSDIDEGGNYAVADDFAFRRKNTRARGFLTRPHLPTDR